MIAKTLNCALGLLDLMRNASVTFAQSMQKQLF